MPMIAVYIGIVLFVVVALCLGLAYAQIVLLRTRQSHELALAQTAKPTSALLDTTAAHDATIESLEKRLVVLEAGFLTLKNKKVRA